MSALDLGSRADETSLIGCPYCGRIIGKEQIRNAEVLDHICHNCENLGEWHEGVFRVEVLKLEGKRTKPAEKNRPGRYNLHCVGGGGIVDRIFFTFTEIEVRKGDIISLSFKRVPKKVMNKTWGGNYSDNPSLLVNSRNKRSYKI
jgi:hypothetical protein